MLKRTITGLIILIITAGFVLLKQFSPLFFDTFALIIIFGSIFEVIKAYKKGNNEPYSLLLYLSPVISFVGILVARKLYAGIDSRIILSSFLVLFLTAIIVLMLSLTFDILTAAKNRKQQESSQESQPFIDAFKKTKITMQILAYPVLPLMFLILINSLSYQLGFLGLVLTFAVAMMTDTFAYLFGRMFGKRKFIPEVSPKKTIAGVIGGFVGGIIAAGLVFVIFYFTNYFDILNNVSLIASISSLAIVGLFGAYITQLGDLIASSLKRKVDLKDYSNIFPGHGGFMDRVDGQMFVAVLSFIILALTFV